MRGNSLVNLCWIFSIASSSFFKCGLHDEIANSTCILTTDLYSCSIVFSSLFWKDRQILPSILFATDAATCLSTFKLFKFFGNGQIPMSDETVSQFVSRLRGLASTCNFGTFLPRALRDQFVVGCCNSESQHKLLQEALNFH